MTLFQQEMASLLLDGLCIVTCLLFRAEYKPRGYYLEHVWQADMGLGPKKYQKNCENVLLLYWSEHEMYPHENQF